MMHHLTLRGWVAGVLVSTVCLASSAAWSASQPGFSGVWWTKSHQPRLAPAGGALPFTAEGRALYAKNMAGLASGELVDQAVRLCLPQGLPRAMTTAYPFQIMMTPGEVTFMYEENRTFRIVAITDKHASPDDWDPSFMGDGIGAWDGATLVVDSNNFKASKIYLDATGLPASDQLHVLERIKLIDGGRKLEDVITVTDPVIFSKPWSVKRVFERHDEVELQTDWVCGEPHRDVSAVTKGAKK